AVDLDLLVREAGGRDLEAGLDVRSDLGPEIDDPAGDVLEALDGADGDTLPLKDDPVLAGVEPAAVDVLEDDGEGDGAGTRGAGAAGTSDGVGGRHAPRHDELELGALGPEPGRPVGDVGD